MTVDSIKRQILPILKKQGVTKAALFGSAARGEMKKGSDIDVLVRMGKGKSLFDLVGLKFDLEEKLGRKVDVVTYRGIHHLLRDSILNGQKIIYEKRS